MLPDHVATTAGPVTTSLDTSLNVAIARMQSWTGQPFVASAYPGDLLGEQLCCDVAGHVHQLPTPALAITGPDRAKPCRMVAR